MSETTVAPKERTLIGRVVSARMDKTAGVLVERLERHPVYDKFVRRSTKLLAHDEANECRAGDIVTIAPCRPLSKRKSWRITAIVERLGGAGPAETGTSEEEVAR